MKNFKIESMSQNLFDRLSSFVLHIILQIEISKIQYLVGNVQFNLYRFKEPQLLMYNYVHDPNNSLNFLSVCLFLLDMGFFFFFEKCYLVDNNCYAKQLI
jgi:hypothetical protein